MDSIIEQNGASQVALVVKNPSTNAGDVRDMGSIPGSGRSPGGHGNPLQCSYLENPMDRGTWQATAHRVAMSQTRLKQLSMRAHTTQKQAHTHKKQTCGCSQGGRHGGGKYWECGIIQRVDKQQGPTAYHRELYSVSCDKP